MRIEQIEDLLDEFDFDKVKKVMDFLDWKYFDTGILAVTAVKLLATPLIAWSLARLLFSPMQEAQYAAVVEGATPGMVTALLLADRFRLDHGAAALLIGWSTILFWITLPLGMALGLIR